METLQSGSETDLETRGEPHAAVSWSAIIAGAVAAIAVSTIVIALAAGFDTKLDASGRMASPSAAANMIGVWLITAQAASGALGGYLAGRLRTVWLNVHGHEVHFRDTAHGFLAWALATVIGAAIAAHVGPAESAAPVSPAFESEVALLGAVALLTGAFVAAVAGAVGGMRRGDMRTKFDAERRSAIR